MTTLILWVCMIGSSCDRPYQATSPAVIMYTGLGSVGSTNYNLVACNDALEVARKHGMNGECVVHK